MKKMTALILSLMLLMPFAWAQNEENTWYEANENVLTIRVPVDVSKGESCEYLISNPYALELLTHEYVDGENLYAASFLAFAPFEGTASVAVCRKNMDGTLMEVRRAELLMDETGAIAISKESNISPDDDFSVFFNPLNYPLFLVDNVYTPDSSGIVCIEGSFGDYAFPADEENLVFVGFDEENPVTVSLAEDCKIKLFADFDNLNNLVEVEDLLAWYEDACELLGFSFSFHAVPEMNENGQITSLEYFYIP
ncbi:MAG: hypothetical protein IJC48_05770 [Clostridia bacterium]|nr:hypothetical protein [Clostridia bacterium]